MEVLIVYGSQFGTTEHLANAMATALSPMHTVYVRHAREADRISGRKIDLLIVGAPTQMHGLRLLVRPFLAGLADHGFRDVAAAAFDTRGAGSVEQTGSAAVAIARRLERAGCRLVRPPEGVRGDRSQGTARRGRRGAGRGLGARRGCGLDAARSRAGLTSGRAANDHDRARRVADDVVRDAPEE